jgi:hypothetical protein
MATCPMSNLSFETKLWLTADKMRNTMDAALFSI